MAETKTKPTRVSVDKFIAAVENDTRRADAKTLLKVFKESVVGFSPRKAHLVIYVFDFTGKTELLQKLGKYKGGLKQCLYINKLADVDLDVLRTIIKAGVVQAKNSWPVTPS
jgi:hypothetical protein